MAELTTPAQVPTSSCCAPEAQADCCEPADKDGCCPSTASGDGCGCPAGQAAAVDIRETVREKYAAAARQAADAGDWCCEAGFDPADTGGQTFGPTLYAEDGAHAPAQAVNASLGCGVPTAVADLQEGETVLDLGSGAGADVLISGRRVGPTGRAIGLDMTDEMLELARANAADAGVQNVEFVKGYIEDVPLPDGSVDVIISNCVINLAADKRKVISEAARVLRPGGRFAVSDVIADEAMDDATRADMAAYTGCIAGALTEAEFRAALATAGFVDIDIRPTHRVHEAAQSAIVRARKPKDAAIAMHTSLASRACCSPSPRSSTASAPPPRSAPTATPSSLAPTTFRSACTFLTLAHRRTRDCPRQDDCTTLAARH